MTARVGVVEHRAQPTRTRTRTRQTAAQTAALLADERTAHAHWSDREIARRRKRLAQLRNTLYGREVLIHDGPAGGCRGGICCSHAWADDCWEFETAYPPPIEPATHRGSGGEGHAGAGAINRGMTRCPTCGAMVPPIYLDSSGHCQDCHLDALPDEQSSRLQASSSVVDYYQLRRRK